MKKLKEFSSKQSVRKNDLINSISTALVIALVIFSISFFVNSVGLIYVSGGEITSGLHKAIDFESFQFAQGYSEEFIVCAVPFVIGFIQFFFLTNKERCYNMLSLPIKRKSLFNNRYFIPLLIMLSVILITKVITLFVNIDVIGYSNDLAAALIYNLTACIQLCFTSYTISVLSCVFCNKLSEAVLFGISVQLSFFYTITAIIDVIAYTLRGMAYKSIDELFVIRNFAEPLTNDTGSYQSELYALDRPYLSLIFWLAVTVIALVLIKKYFEKSFKPEKCGMLAVNNVSIFYISYTAATAVSLNVGILCNPVVYFDDLSNSRFIILAVSVITSLVVSVVAGLLLTRSLKKIKIPVLGGVASSAVFLLTAFICLTGIFGEFNKVPKAEDVLKVELTFPFGYVLGDSQVTDLLYDSKEGIIANEMNVVFTDIDDIKHCIEAHKLIVSDDSHKVYDYGCFTYTMKDGTTVSRDYAYISSKAAGEYLNLWDSDAVKEKYHQYIFPDKGDWELDMHGTYIEMTSKYEHTMVLTECISKSDIDVIRNAYIRDIESFSANDWFNSDSEFLGVIEMSPVVVNRITNESAMVDFSCEMPIKANMVNTISALKELGLYDFLLQKQEIEWARIGDYRQVSECINSELPYEYYFEDVYLDNMYYEDLPLTDITDKDELELLINKAQAYSVTEENDNILIVKYKVKDDLTTPENELYQNHTRVYLVKEGDINV